MNELQPMSDPTALRDEAKANTPHPTAHTEGDAAEKPSIYPTPKDKNYVPGQGIARTPLEISAEVGKILSEHEVSTSAANPLVTLWLVRLTTIIFAIIQGLTAYYASVIAYLEKGVSYTGYITTTDPLSPHLIALDALAAGLVIAAVGLLLPRSRSRPIAVAGFGIATLALLGSACINLSDLGHYRLTSLIDIAQAVVANGALTYGGLALVTFLALRYVRFSR